MPKIFKQTVFCVLIWGLLAGISAVPAGWAKKTAEAIGDVLHKNIEYSAVLQCAEGIWHALKN